jgi:hypothetical protein
MAHSSEYGSVSEAGKELSGGRVGLLPWKVYCPIANFMRAGTQNVRGRRSLRDDLCANSIFPYEAFPDDLTPRSLTTAGQVRKHAESATTVLS